MKIISTIQYILIFMVIILLGINQSVDLGKCTNNSTLIYVGGIGEGNFSSIQQAISSANVYSKILVYPGIYNESIDVYKPLHLESIGSNQVKIIYGGKDDVVEISADGCSFIGFNISHLTGEGFTSVTISSDNNLIRNNTFYKNPGRGLYIYRCQNNTVENNIFFSDGIHIVGNKKEWNTHTIINNRIEKKSIVFFKNKVDHMISRRNYGQIIFANCSNSCIKNCTVNNGDQGILIGHSSRCTIENNIVKKTKYAIHLSYSCNCTISSNVISNNHYGLYLIHSTNNIFFSNHIENNSLFGCWICCNSIENTLFCNYFINNNQSAYDLFSNQWSYNKRGNYWSDYCGLDKNEDDIGDIPYEIFDESTIDRFPLMNKNFSCSKFNNTNEKEIPSISFKYIIIALIFIYYLRRKNEK